MLLSSRSDGRKRQRLHFSGKKKRHTQKTQSIVNQWTQAIVATAFANGSQHDLVLFKESRCLFSKQSHILADSGYLGLNDLHANNQIPAKKSKLHPLTKERKAGDRQLSHERVLVENVIRRLRIFRILSGRYGNRRRRFSIGFNLIAFIYNLELESAKCITFARGLFKNHQSVPPFIWLRRLSDIDRIAEDPARLPDYLWRRAVEIILLAGMVIKTPDCPTVGFSRVAECSGATLASTSGQAANH